MVKLLIELGVYVDARNDERMTAVAHGIKTWKGGECESAIG
jgi:hypothetical protein